MSWQHLYVTLWVTSCLEQSSLIRLLGAFHPRPHALSFIHGLFLCAPWCCCFPFPLTPGNAEGEINHCQHSNTFQLWMPGHSRTSFAFLYLKVQLFIVSPYHTIHSHLVLWRPVYGLGFKNFLATCMVGLQPPLDVIWANWSPFH